MTNPEMEKAMEFILKQQAQNTIDIQRLSEAHQRMSESHARLAEAQQQGEERVAKLENVVLRLANVVTDLAEVHKETDKRLAEMRADTYRKWNETDERLNALIIMFERHMGEHEKGRDGSGEARNT